VNQHSSSKTKPAVAGIDKTVWQKIQDELAKTLLTCIIICYVFQYLLPVTFHLYSIIHF